ncbi:MAG: hypothetical protein ACOC0O_04015 [Spirochaetota bacterium]
MRYLGIMSFAEELIQEGLQKGRQEGEVLGKRSALLRHLSRKFSVTDAERERILSCDDSDALDAALDEFAPAKSKAQVLERLP